MRRVVLSIIATSGMLTGAAWGNSDVTGTIRTVYTSKAWNGIFVKLNVTQLFEPGSACANDFAYISIDDPMAKAHLAVLLSAKATGEPVVIRTAGCISAPLALAVKLDGVEYAPR